jgi:hypothetical protein
MVPEHHDLSLVQAYPRCSEQLWRTLAIVSQDLFEYFEGKGGLEVTEWAFAWVFPQQNVRFCLLGVMG